MLHELRLTYFRQHEKRTFKFTKGINLLRGPNEGGKSTILEAVTYAVGGAPALTETLDAMVTWDHKESELAVGLDIEIAGVMYTVERSQKGATLTSPSLEKKVTGQREVTGFFSELLGGSAKTLGMLLMASQSGLQDVITAGPGEVSQLVAKIGSMDIVDNVIKQADKDLILGNERVLADRVATTEERVRTLVSEAVSDQAVADLVQRHATSAAELAEADMAVSGLWNPAVEASAISLNAGLAAESHVSALEAQRQTVMVALAATKAALKQARSVEMPDPVVLSFLLAEQSQLQELVKRLAVKAKVDAINTRVYSLVWDAEKPGQAGQELAEELVAAKQKAAAIRDEAFTKLGSPEIALIDQRRIEQANMKPFAAEIEAVSAKMLDGYRVADLNKANSSLFDIGNQLRASAAVATRVLKKTDGNCPTCGQKFVDAAARAAHDAAELAVVEAAKVEFERLNVLMRAGHAEVAEIEKDIVERRDGLTKEKRRLEEAQRHIVNETVAVLDGQRAVLVAEAAKARDESMALFTKANGYAEKLQRLVNEGQDAILLGLALKEDKDVEVSYDFFPPKITWTGDIGQTSRTAAVIQADIDAQGRLRSAYDRAQGMIESLAATEVTQESQVANLDAQITVARSAVPDLNVLRADYNEKVGHQQAAMEVVKAKREVVAIALNDVQAINGKRERNLQDQKRAQEEQAKAVRDLDELSFNNEFMKTTKLLKPQITEYMWSKGLQAISGYFSNLRGVPVKVTRLGGEFLFNGRPATSLSGSGKDILAIAIRAALSRTFLPNVGFMSLDEPAHGSDEVRTSKILAFLASSGFDQTILASHDPLSESIADNIIYVGEV